MKFRVRRPCDEGWERMEPRPGGRHCARCDHTVVDFTRMTRAQAQARVARARGPVCGHVRVDRGTREVVFVPEPSRAPRWAGGLVLAAALAGTGCDRAAERDATEIAASEAAGSGGASDGPPMAPVDPSADAGPGDAGVTRALRADEIDLPASSGRPTAAQRALTARKHAPVTPAISPHHDVIDGMMDPFF